MASLKYLFIITVLPHAGLTQQTAKLVSVLYVIAIKNITSPWKNRKKVFMSDFKVVNSSLLSYSKLIVVLGYAS